MKFLGVVGDAAKVGCGVIDAAIGIGADVEPDICGARGDPHVCQLDVSLPVVVLDNLHGAPGLWAINNSCCKNFHCFLSLPLAHITSGTIGESRSPPRAVACAARFT